jgi:O-antigen/teichoic acid export membrane protein
MTEPAVTPLGDHRGQLEKLARRGTASVVGAAASAVFGVLLVVVVTNGFSPTVAGTLFAATSAFLILEAVALLGTDTGLVRLLPVQLASGRAADLRRTLTIAAAPVVLLSLALGVVLYVGAAAMAPLLAGTEAAPTMTVMLRALALALPVATLHAVVMAATRGIGTMRPTVVVENVGRFALQALAVLVVLVAGGGALALAVAWSAPYLLGLVVGAAWLRRLVAARTRADGVPRGWGGLAREFWAYTAPRAIARIVQAGLKRSDIVLVAALASPADAALYTAATRFIVLGQLFIQAVQQALSPQMSSLFARGEIRAADSVFQAATSWSMIAAWPLYLVTAGAAPLLMGIFGDGYDTASDVVVVLSLTMLLATACGPVDAVLLMAGRSWLSLRNNLVALVVNLTLSVVLIPVAGLMGAAVAHAAAIVVRNLLPLAQVRRQLAMWPLTRSTVLVAAAALGCYGAPAVVLALADPPAGMALTLVGIASLAYATITWSLRTALGLEAFRATVRRRRRDTAAPSTTARGDDSVAAPGGSTRAVNRYRG